MTSLVSVIGDNHTCPMITGDVPHVGGPIDSSTASTILIEGINPAVVGSTAVCVGEPDTLVSGSSSVFMSSVPVCRIGDSTEHGGVIDAGVSSVFAGG